jgi:hypothetical protein
MVPECFDRYDFDYTRKQTLNQIYGPSQSFLYQPVDTIEKDRKGIGSLRRYRNDVHGRTAKHISGQPNSNANWGSARG